MAWTKTAYTEILASTTITTGSNSTSSEFVCDGTDDYVVANVIVRATIGATPDDDITCEVIPVIDGVDSNVGLPTFKIDAVNNASTALVYPLDFAVDTWDGFKIRLTNDDSTDSVTLVSIEARGAHPA